MVNRPNPIDLQRIRDEVEQLDHACRAFDSRTMSPTVCTNIATISLRKLLYDRPPQSVSVLTHLGLKEAMQFYDGSVGALKSDFPVAHCGLAGFGPAGHRPNLDCEVTDASQRRFVSFTDWWNEPVIWDARGRSFSRAAIVLTAADKDGGAHLDATLPDEYWDLVNRNSLGRGVGVGGSWTSLGSPIPASVRHIGHEVLVSIAVALPVAFRSKQHAHAYRTAVMEFPCPGPVITGFAVHGEKVDDMPATDDDDALT